MYGPQLVRFLFFFKNYSGEAGEDVANTNWYLVTSRHSLSIQPKRRKGCKHGLQKKTRGGFMFQLLIGQLANLPRLLLSSRDHHRYELVSCFFCTHKHMFRQSWRFVWNVCCLWVQETLQWLVSLGFRVPLIVVLKYSHGNGTAR